MLKLEDAIYKEENSYIFRCSVCSKIIKCKPYYLEKHSGKCRSCVMRKPPFFHVYTRFVNTAKYEKHQNELSYEDFLVYTKIDKCHYCMKSVPWMEYCYANNNYTRGGYFLDRKDNRKGYSKQNCVVACTRCNKGKGAHFTYDEWFGMTQYLRNCK